MRRGTGRGRLPRVVVMGGAFHVAGNVTPHAEFNVYVDPEAAAEVFAVRDLEITVVGLDVTRQVALPKTVWQTAASRDERPANLVYEVSSGIERIHGDAPIYLHDPLAVAAALDPDLLLCESRSVTVSCAQETRGEVRAERSGHVRVATAVDRQRFTQRFASALGLIWVEDPTSAAN